jgi:hypothetical protein
MQRINIYKRSNTKHSKYNTHITKTPTRTHTHTLKKPTHTPHIAKQVKVTTVQDTNQINSDIKNIFSPKLSNVCAEKEVVL